MEEVTEITFLSMASMEDVKEYFNELPQQLEEFLDADYDRGFKHLLSTLYQFFDIVDTVNVQAKEGKRINENEATEIGNHGFVVLLKLSDLMEKLDLPHKRKEIEQISLVFARWVIRFNGKLHHLEPIVNAFAQAANTIQERESLTALANLLNLIVAACADPIKHDLNSSSLYRPWRLLHINRCIIATRTHNLEIMKRAFDEILLYLPKDAKSFFKEGMKEMVEKNYPQHVRDLMQHYHQSRPSMSVH